MSYGGTAFGACTAAQAGPDAMAIPIDDTAIRRQNRYAVPGTFAQPDSAIAEVTKGTGRKRLEANDVGLSPCEPSREILQTIVDIVDVKVAIFNGSASCEKTMDRAAQVLFRTRCVVPQA
jgi:hypothetical protein